jgi:hypothetical protein
MKTYLSDIIPKIKRFSRKLDELTLLTNQEWVVLDELTQSKVKYIFLPDGELLIASNGIVGRGRWRYIGQNSILIDLMQQSQSLLFKHGFFDENILALKLDGKEGYAILINESKYEKELNSLDAVSQFLKQKYPLNLEKIDIELGELVSTATITLIDNGRHALYQIRYRTGEEANFYHRKSTLKKWKYFIYLDGGYIMNFPNREACIRYITEDLIRKHISD